MEASGDMDDKLLKEILKTAGWLFWLFPPLFCFVLFCSAIFVCAANP